jgi:Fic family protein
MDIALFKNSPSGRLTRTSGGYWAFVPNPLPPKIEWDNALVSVVSRADIAVGTLSGLGETLPNPHLLIYPFVRREAVMSSRIEGTRSSLSDLLLFEATKIERQRDVKEVQNYVSAMEYGLKRLNELPLSLRFIRELHSILMEGVRGEHATAGEFRQSQNWIGPPGCALNEATFIPPPAPEMQECLNQLEKFLHTEKDLPLLVQLALVHYQFEAVHPFLDGNGRIGRLLITLFLCQRGVLTKPLLYLSAFFERHRQEYYDLLLKISQEGAWREWIEFFLRAVVEQSGDAVSRARRLLDLHHTYTQVSREKKLTPTAGQLIELIFMRPLLNARAAQEYLNVTFPAAQKALNALVEAEILAEITGGRRNRVYAAKEILEVLEEDIIAPRAKDNEDKKRAS